MPEDILVNVDDVEWSHLQLLADQNGMTVEQVVKLLLRRELDRIPRLLLDDEPMRRQ